MKRSEGEEVADEKIQLESSELVSLHPVQFKVLFVELINKTISESKLRLRKRSSGFFRLSG